MHPRWYTRFILCSDEKLYCQYMQLQERDISISDNVTGPSDSVSTTKPQDSDSTIHATGPPPPDDNYSVTCRITWWWQCNRTTWWWQWQELTMDGDCYTEAQCEAVVLCGNNHWIIILPQSTQSHLRLLASTYFCWNHKCSTYLGWTQKQPIIQQLPSVRHTDETQQGRNSCLWLFHLCLLDDWGGDHWLP